MSIRPTKEDRIRAEGVAFGRHDRELEIQMLKAAIASRDQQLKDIYDAIHPMGAQYGSPEYFKIIRLTRGI